MLGFFLYAVLVLFTLVSLLLIMIILIQKGRGGGLAGAFGGMGGNTAFGAKTGDVLTWATSVIFGVLLLLAIALNLMANYRHAQMTNPAVAEQTAPAQPATPIEQAVPIEPAAEADLVPQGSATQAEALPPDATESVPATPETPAEPAVPAAPQQ